MANSSKDDIPFRIQEGKAPDWSIVADTGMPSPLDITEPGEKRPLASLDYQVKARSVVVLYRQRRGTRS